MLRFLTLWDIPILLWGLLATPLQWGPLELPASHVPGITIHPHSLLIQTFPQLLPALSSQAGSFSYQVPCFVSLSILMGTSLYNSLHCSQRESLFVSQRRPLLLFDLPPTAPSTICCRAFQRVVPDPLSQDLECWPEILSTSYVI